jgi:hypothetical protein
MTAPITPLLDDFNRANENPLNASAVWSNQNLNQQTGGCQLLSNQLAPIAATGESRCTIIDFPRDVEFWVTVATFTSQIDLAYRGISLGAGNWNGYLFEVFGGNWQFYRIDGGSATAVGAGFGSSPASGDRALVRAYGSTHELWTQTAGGAWVLGATRTEATYLTAGRVELGFGSNTTGRFDDFGGGFASPARFSPHRMPLGV